MKNKKTFNIVLTGLLAAIIFILTFINIKLPISINGGLIHLGGVGLIVASYILMPKNAGLAAGIGMGLFDILGGYTIWAPFTFVIRFIQGYITSKLLTKKGGKNEIIALILSSIIAIVGYYIAEVILYGNFIAPLTSIPGEVILSVAGISIGLPLSKILIKNKVYYK